MSDESRAGFAMIPTHLRGRLTPFEIATYVGLCWRVNEYGECWPSHSTLAEDTGISKRMIGVTLKSLKDKGVLEIEERVQENGGNSSNLYRLLVWKVHERGAAQDAPPVAPHVPTPVAQPATPYSMGCQRTISSELDSVELVKPSVRLASDEPLVGEVVAPTAGPQEPKPNPQLGDGSAGLSASGAVRASQPVSTELVQSPLDGLETRESAVPAPRNGNTADTFDVFWQLTLKKTGKGAAKAAFLKAARQVPANTIIAAWEEANAAWRTWAEAERQFIPMPATWLNGGRWDDDPPELYRGHGGYKKMMIRDAVRAHETGQLLDGTPIQPAQLGSLFGSLMRREAQ